MDDLKRALEQFPARRMVAEQEEDPGLRDFLLQFLDGQERAARRIDCAATAKLTK